MRCRLSPLWLLAVLLLVASGCGEQRPEPSIGAGVEFEEKKPSNTALNYELVDTLSPGIEKLRAVDVAGPGTIYAAGDGGVVVLDGDGTVADRWRTEGPVHCVDVGADGTVYTGLETKVIAYSPDGTEQTS